MRKKTIEERIKQFDSIKKEAREIFIAKNNDYGDAFAEYGPVGVIIRAGDKIKRLQTITNNSVVLVNDEQLRDTLLDLHNYSAMALMLLDESE